MLLRKFPAALLLLGLCAGAAAAATEAEAAAAAAAADAAVAETDLVGLACDVQQAAAAALVADQTGLAYVYGDFMTPEDQAALLAAMNNAWAAGVAADAVRDKAIGESGAGRALSFAAAAFNRDADWDRTCAAAAGAIEYLAAARADYAAAAAGYGEAMRYALEMKAITDRYATRHDAGGGGPDPGAP